MKQKRKMILLAILLLLIVVVYVYLFMGSRVKNTSNEVIKGDMRTKSLVVYFSRYGELAGDVDAVTSATPNSNVDMDENESDTGAAAKMIQNLTGADLYQIHTKRYYRKAFSGTAATAWIEETLNLRPKLAAQPENLDNYDTIYIGYPIWWYTAPMVIGTFLENYDLTGVDVYPFTQSASMDTDQFDNSMKFVRECAPGANVHDGMFVEATDTDGIQSYLTENGF